MQMIARYKPVAAEPQIGSCFKTEINSNNRANEKLAFLALALKSILLFAQSPREVIMSEQGEVNSSRWRFDVDFHNFLLFFFSL